jgi:hypothetical protein
MTVSVTQTVQSWKIQWLMHNELEGKWKEMMENKFKVLSWLNIKKGSWSLSQNLTQDILNMKQEH